MSKIGIIGIGNPLMTDDGIGLVLLEKLRNEKQNLKNVEYIDGGTGGLNLLHTISNFDTVIFIDAVHFDGKLGESRLLKLDEIKSKKNIKLNSTHSIDFLKAIDISKKLGQKQKNIFIFAVQPKDISFGTKISKELNQKIKTIFEDLVDNVNKICKE